MNRFPNPRIVLAQSPQSSAARQQKAQSNPATAEAIAAFERGDADMARRLFEEALSADPKNTTALTFLGLIADQNGKLAEAAAHFEKAVKIDPDQAPARNNYGAILLKLGRRREAANQFEASLRLDNRQMNALVNLAQLRSESGKKEDLRAALDLFERASVIAPDAEIMRALTVIALRLGEREAASRRYKDYSRLLEKQTAAPAPETRAELGAAMSEAGLFSEAVAELTAALQASPSDSETVLHLARAYIELHDLPGAGKTLEAAISRGVETGPVYALLSKVYEKTGHIDRAIPAMRLAIEREPQSEQRRFEYGMLLTNAMAPAAAIIRLEESLRLFPKSSRLWFAMGIARFKQNQNEEAAQAFARASEMDRKFAAPLVYLGMTRVEKGLYAEAHYQLGLVYSRLRRKDDAKTSMARFKQLSDSEKEQAMKERKEIIDRLSKTTF